MDTFFHNPQRKPPCSERSTQAMVHYPAQLRKSTTLACLPGSQGLQPWYLHRRHRGMASSCHLIFRMVEAGRNLWGPSGPTLLSSGAEPAAQDAG